MIRSKTGFGLLKFSNATAPQLRSLESLGSLLLKSQRRCASHVPLNHLSSTTKSGLLQYKKQEVINSINNLISKPNFIKEFTKPSKFDVSEHTSWNSFLNSTRSHNELNLNKSSKDDTNDKPSTIEKKNPETETEDGNGKGIKNENENEIDIDIEQPDKNDKNIKTPDPLPKKSTSKSTSKKSSSSAAVPPPSGNNGDDDPKSKKHGKANSTTTVLPEVYPQVMALPISRRPLFPGFYKAVVISDPSVMKAIREMLERRQPYIGAFLLKDENAETDVITNVDEVYPVGVFAQITSAFPSKDEKTGIETMTALLYPHRRIKIDELIPVEINEKNDSEKIEIKKEKSLVDQFLDAENDSDLVSFEKPDKIIEEETKELKENDQDKENEKIKENDDAEKVTENDEDESNPTAFLHKHNISLVNVSNLEDESFDRKSPVIIALTSEILKVFKEISQLNVMFREQIATFSASIQSATTNIFDQPARLADFAAAVSAGEELELQEVLNALNIEERLEKSLVVLKKELMNAELQNKISKDVESKIQKRQREYYLMEQLKGIKRELGIDDGRDKLIATFKERAEKLTMPEAVRKVFDDEVNKLATLETAMSEFGVIRNYLDWLTSLPWGIASKEQYDIPKALKVLEDDHYGMKDVKDRILEFIAVGKLLGTVDGKILCFVGPPGVGKTSIGKSIARALNRSFYRFSVGGVSDVAEIKGHRRTYIGALPGRVIQALKKCQTENPLILIDEIDKIGHAGMHGDPAAALLELLDPEQNNSFLDHYMDVPIDLSKVLFVCTANITDTIPRPLLDRMEVIELSGYIADEKLAIAQNYLAPDAKNLSGLKDTKVILENSAIESLIRHYCRESGVRNLKKHIEKVYRKAALKIVKDLGEEGIKDEKDEIPVKEIKEIDNDETNDVNLETEKTEEKSIKLIVPDSVEVHITSENLSDYVGPPVFTKDRIYDETPPGVVMGLAWTQLGGVPMYVESVLEQPISIDSHAGLDRTGQLGDVMKESTLIAYSFVRMFAGQKFPKNRFFEKAKIHLHCPEGAVPKDGPSAGVTMATSFMSLALNKSLDPTIAMTGELTLTGKVLRIGGLREKTVAAKRSGATTIIFPKDNLADWLDLPENIREGIEAVPAEWYQDVFNRVFKDVNEKDANEAWKVEFDKIDAEKEKHNKK